MKTILKLAIANLKSNKLKSIMTLVAIILTTVLLTTIATLSIHNFIDNKRFIEETSGKSHMWLKQINDEDYNQLKKRSDLEIVAGRTHVGKMQFQKNYLDVSYVDPLCHNSEIIHIPFIKGTMPIEENEIIMDEEAIKLLGYTPKIGEIIELEMVITSAEKNVKEKFKLVGITKARDDYKLRNTYFAKVSEKFFYKHVEADHISMLVFIKFRDIQSKEEVYHKVAELTKELGIKEKYKYVVNEQYLNSTKPDIQMLLLALLQVLVICISAMLIIYNIFHISVISQVQIYGKISALGVSPRQIRRLIFYESSILAAVGISIGIIVGYIINHTLISNIMNIKMSDTGEYNLYIIVGTILVSYVTILMSVMLPMKKASDISPVEAIRYANKRGSKKAVKGHKNISITKLAYSNIWLNKSRTIITILSLAFSGILFISVSSLMQSTDAERIARRNFSSNGSNFILRLHNYSFEGLNKIQLNNPLTDEFLQEIRQKKGFKNLVITNEVKASFKDKPLAIRGRSKDYFMNLEEKNITKGIIDIDSLVHNNELVIGSYLASELEIDVGDVMELKLYDGDQVVSKDFKIQALLKDRYEIMTTNDKIIQMCQSNTKISVEIIVDMDSYDEMDNFLRDYTSNYNYLLLFRYKDELKVIKKVLFKRAVVFYGLIVILGIIGFMNFINTIITSIIARKKELSIMQAIGLSYQQLKKMLYYESSFYIMSTFILSTVVGGVLGYLLTYQMEKISGAIIYSFPYMNVLLLIGFLIIGQALLINYLTSFSKIPLVERIKFSE